ncbi:MAG TPA: MerR family transcriptional regulator [Streptosporangiaceae bacterium]|nr:MerR family transcriptional regulator [Streptosporangiaceae bacterium]
MTTPDATWKVGALARATGMSVRALHYYDEIGLLRPSARSYGGHRLYDTADVARLYQVSLLRRLGFPLEQIAAVLDHPEWQLGPAIDRHLAEVQRRAAITASLATRLAAMSAALTRHDNPSPEELFSTLEEMTMLDSTAIRGTTGLLVYDDLAAAHEYLTRVFGLTAGPLERAPDGTAVHGEVRAGDQVIWLHPAGPGFGSPRSLGGVTSMTVVNVEDADAHYARSRAAGADILKEPVNQPYGVREYGARDLEGQLWYFHAPLD